MKRVILLPLEPDEFEFIFYIFSAFAAARMGDMITAVDASRQARVIDDGLRERRSALGRKLADLSETLL